MNLKPVSNDRYFQFPLCLLQNIHNNVEKGINLIMAYSIVNFAKKANYNMADVGRQLSYDLYRNRDVMQLSLRKKLEQYIKYDKLTLDEDYNGFAASGEFNPDTNMEELEILFANDSVLEQQAILHYQLNCAKSVLRITINSNDWNIVRYEEGVKQMDQHAVRFGNDPMPGIKTDLLFEFRDKKSGNASEIELLCGLVAVRSLIGQRPFTPTHKSVIAMRMIGAKSKMALEECLKKKELKAVYDKYSKRYHIDKMIDKLRQRNFIQSKIAIDRSIFLSTKLTMPELEEAVLEYKRKKDFKPKREEERLARKRILQQLYNGAAKQQDREQHTEHH